MKKSQEDESQKCDDTKEGKRKTRQSKQKSPNDAQPKMPKTNAELIQELESLESEFNENNEEWNKRQTILARKLQTLERSRFLQSRQKTRSAQKEIDYTMLQGRITRGGLKNLK